MPRQAFTLIELLVIIVIGTVLTSLLLQGLGVAQDHARAVQCRAHQHQISVSFSLYESDNQTFPYGFDNLRVVDQSPPGGNIGNVSEDRVAWWWFHYLSPYMGAEFRETHSLIRCPARNIFDVSVFENPLLGNYGVNQSVCKSTTEISHYQAFAGVPLGTDSISHPAKTLVLVDSGYPVIKWFHATENPPWSPQVYHRQDTAYIPSLWVNPLRDIWPDQLPDALEGRHLQQTVNAFFGDGHVEQLSPATFYVDNSAGLNAPTAIWDPH